MTTHRPASGARGDNLVTVDIAEFKVSKDPGAVIVTYALGSCIAVTVYDPNKKIGGMIHYMLPMSKVSKDKADKNPAMFADTGIPLLFNSIYELGADKNDLVVKVIGGGSLYDDNQVFNIGKRNYVTLRKMFWKNSITISAEDVGGTKSRTARLFVETGRVTVRSQGQEVEL